MTAEAAEEQQHCRTHRPSHKSSDVASCFTVKERQRGSLTATVLRTGGMAELARGWTAGLKGTRPTRCYRVLQLLLGAEKSLFSKSASGVTLVEHKAYKAHTWENLELCKPRPVMRVITRESHLLLLLLLLLSHTEI